MKNDFEYLTVQQIFDCPHYPFTRGQLRQFLIKREENGLKKAVRRIGKRIYFRKDLFEQWIENHQEK